jgi:hypothetical protein
MSNSMPFLLRIVFYVCAIVMGAMMVFLTKRGERMQGARVETGNRNRAKGPLSVHRSSIIIIRDNGVTVYDSKGSAEASMEWADVERNPKRRAFDAKGIEFVFKRRAAMDHAAPIHALWNGTDPKAVELESKSVIPHPDTFREALIHWLDGKGIQVEHGIDLEALIRLASRTSYGRPAVNAHVADHGGSLLSDTHAPDVNRIDNRTAAPPNPGSIQDAVRGMGAIATNAAYSDYVEDIAIRAVVIIRDNGVTVYDSKEKAEESMEWSDVMRNPSRRAFDLKGIELRFERLPFSFYYSNEEFLKFPFWRKLLGSSRRADEPRKDVKLVPISSTPHPDTLRDLLVRWLDGKGVTVDGGLALDQLIVRASETKAMHRSSPPHGMPANPSSAAAPIGRT